MTPFDNAKAFLRACAKALLTVLMVSFCLVGPSSAADPYALNASIISFPRPVRAKVEALGLGAKVKITTVLSHERYRGYITRIDEDSFEVTDRETLSPNTFKYWMVDQVAGRRLPDPAKHAGKGGVTALFSAVSRLGFGP